MIRPVLFAVAWTIATVPAFAQSPADFTGSWTLDRGFSVGAARADRRMPTVVIRQTPGDLIIAAAGGSLPPVRYRLDGVESASVSGRTRIVTRSRWDRDRLETVGTRRFRLFGLPLGSRFIETRWLTDGGRTMVVEWTGIGQHHPHLRKLVFRRATRPDA